MIVDGNGGDWLIGTVVISDCLMGIVVTIAWMTGTMLISDCLGIVVISDWILGTVVI